MCEIVPPEIYEVLKTVVKDDIEDYEITIHDPNKKGEGYMGELVYLTLESRQSDRRYHIVVKQAFKEQKVRDAHPIRDLFVNEIYFYSRILSSFQKFQKKIAQKCQFTKLPKFFASTCDDNSEMLVLENLKFQDFQVHDKKVPLDRDHYEVIMMEYGKFHALSLAYRTLYPEDYARLVKGQLDLYSNFMSKEYFHTALRMSVESSLESLQPEVDDAIKDKLKPYLENCLQYFRNCMSCTEKYSVITHGDCWSNNMMFKYDGAGKVSDIRFLDFQLSIEGSPCCDLSCCLYSGASKEVLQDLDHYLKVYHNSISETLKAFGCDPEEVYPLRVLKEQWKQYCKFGIMLGFIIWKMKFTYEDRLLDLKEDSDESEEMYNTGYDKDKYNEVCRNLLVHLYENDFL